MKTSLEAAKAAGIDVPNYDARLADLSGQIAQLEIEMSADGERAERTQRANRAELVAEYRAEIQRKIDHGFESKEDLFDFARKFKDKDFREQVDALPDEDKKKLAGNVAKKWDEMTPEEKEKMKKEYPELMKWCSEQGYRLESRDNEKVAAIQQEFAKAGNEDGVRAAQHLQVANAQLDVWAARAKTEDVQMNPELRQVTNNALQANMVIEAESSHATTRDYQAGVRDNDDLLEAMLDSKTVSASKAASNEKSALKPTEVAINGQATDRGQANYLG